MHHQIHPNFSTCNCIAAAGAILAARLHVLALIQFWFVLDFFRIKFPGTEQQRKVQDILSYTSLLCVRSSNCCNHHEGIWLETDGNNHPGWEPIQYCKKQNLDCAVQCSSYSQCNNKLTYMITHSGESNFRLLKEYRGYLMSRGGSLIKHPSLTLPQNNKLTTSNFLTG